MPADETNRSGREPAKLAWVERVLGFKVPVAAGPPRLQVVPPSPGNLQAVWRDAKEATDSALEALASELRSYGDPDLERIADFGLFGIGKGENVALNKTLIEFGGASKDRKPAAAKKLREAVAAYRALIAGDLVGDIDNNPFGVKVGIRDTLGRALDDIERAAA